MIPVIASRLGPFIGRQAVKNSGFLGSLVSRLRAAGANVGNKASDVVNYFKSSPVNAALTVSTVAGLGVATTELFKDIDVDGNDLRSFVNGLDATTLQARTMLGQQAHVKVLEAGSHTEQLDLNISENEMDMIAAREVLSWAKAHFGSANAAMRGHRLLQAFAQMPYNDVVSGYENLRV